MIYFGDDEYDVMLEWDSLGGPVEREEMEALVQRLHRLAPAIKWRILTQEHELGTYQVIVVPEDQVRDAEEILELVLEGKGARALAPYRRYPELYMKKGRKWVINPAILRFRQSVSLYYKAVSKGDPTGILTALMKLCCEVHDLPDDHPPENDYVENTYSATHIADFGDRDLFRFINPYGNREADEYSLSEDLGGICQIIERGQDLFDSNEPAKMRHGIRHWKWEYRWTWGRIAARVLPALAAMLIPRLRG